MRITMKIFLMTAAALCMIFLSGCITFNETEAPALPVRFAPEAKLHLEGFQLHTVREKQYKTGGSSYSGTTYKRMPDDRFPGIVKDIFENSGANIRTDKPQLTVEGRIGDGRYLWNSSAMWYRDAPIFVVSVCTLGMIISKERENDVRLIVYNKEGKRLKEYSASERYYTAGIGLPCGFMFNEKMRAWYCDRMAAKFALIKCVNEFIRDCNNGLFK